MRERGGVLEVGLERVTVNADLASTSAELHEGFYVWLSISDDGRGMSPATMEHVFERSYHQGSRSG
jgi:signal transduction histidine kinase